jgi:hypothetical protein
MHISPLQRANSGCSPHIDSIIIPTRNRPLALSRCLSSLLSNCHTFERYPTIYIADASSAEKHHLANETVIHTARYGYKSSITLLSTFLREQLIAWLTSHDCEPEVAEFALKDSLDLNIGNIGATRNLLLMANAGKTYLSIDDDTQAMFSTPTFSCVTEKQQPSRIYLPFESRESLLQSIERTPHLDFISLHERALGPLIKPPQQKPKYDQVFQESLQDDNVILSIAGLFGDCGWGSPTRYLFVGVASDAEFFRSDDAYQRALGSREILQVASSSFQTRTTDDVMTTTYAANTAAGWPPFFPIGRGEDLVMAHILMKCSPHSMLSHIPYAIYHAPTEKRLFSRGEMLRSVPIDISSLILTIVAGYSRSTNDFNSALINIGQLLIDLSCLPHSRFLTRIREYGVQNARNKISYLTAGLDLKPFLAPTYKNDLERLISGLLKYCERPEIGIPIEFLYGRDLSDAGVVVRKIISLFGRLLLAWPSIWYFLQKTPPTICSREFYNMRRNV